jgi:hypothetical protein
MAVFNVAAFRPLKDFKKEVAEFARYLKSTPPSEGSHGVFYPGEIEYLREQERRKIGIEIGQVRLAAIDTKIPASEVQFSCGVSALFLLELLYMGPKLFAFCLSCVSMCSYSRWATGLPSQITAASRPAWS